MCQIVRSTVFCVVYRLHVASCKMVFDINIFPESINHRKAIFMSVFVVENFLVNNETSKKNGYVYVSVNEGSVV